jgi:hypothetical protein
MADDKRGREKQADDAERRQRERELAEARKRGDEAEPPRPGETQTDTDPKTCHRRGCEEVATFVVLERYQEETGQGAVEAEAFLCQEHTDEESPTNLDGAYADYVFYVKPLAQAPTDDA